LFKAIWNEKQLLIALIWSVLIFIGYNVLTAEATEKEDKQVCEDYNGKWTKYEDGERWCKIDKYLKEGIFSQFPLRLIRQL
jgi:hypothetical protein